MEQRRPHEQQPESEVMHQQLQLLRENLARGPYPNYPAHHERLFLSSTDVRARVSLPDGPWAVYNHPCNAHAEAFPSVEKQAELINKGLPLDTTGRPLHPWFWAMASDPSIGVVTGKGAYWYWGPNYTADSIVLCQDNVLLVKRSDNNMWALPGGHVDQGEDSLAAGIREVAEETGLTLPADAVGEIIYQGPVVDPRVTANAWPETTAARYHLESPLPCVVGNDDATEAAWFPVEIALNNDVLFGSHNFLLRQAVSKVVYS